MSAPGTTRTFRDVRAMSVIEGASEMKYSPRVFRMLTQSGRSSLSLYSLSLSLSLSRARVRADALTPHYCSNAFGVCMQKAFVPAAIATLPPMCSATTHMRDGGNGIMPKGGARDSTVRPSNLIRGVAYG